MHCVLSSPRSIGISRRHCVGIVGLVATLFAAVPVVLAQTSPPEIIAKERKDPAAGEVVIINRKKRKDGAPDPYAPIKLKPLPDNISERADEARQTGKKNGTNNQVTKEAAAKPRVPKPVKAARTESPLTPPLPTLNTEQRTASARLGQFPQAGLSPAPRRRVEEQRQPPRRARWSARERREWRRYRDRRRFSNRERPWRHCRRLARRCSAGFEGSCIIWERRC